MSFLMGATFLIGIIFMLTFMFIGIWLFIIALKAYNQLRYKNYILEKINQNLSNMSKKYIDDELNFKGDEESENYIQNILTGDFNSNKNSEFKDSYNAKKDKINLDKKSE